MTIWDTIYRRYLATGEVYATLKKDLIPEFYDFFEQCDCREGKAFDIGCGNGKYLRFLQHQGFEVLGIDSSPTAVALAREALGDVPVIECADMYTYAYPSEAYDLIISIAAIHHGTKDQVMRAIAGLRSALRSGGYFFVTVPDNTGSAHWTTMSGHREIAPGVRVPTTGPEKGLPHSSYTQGELDLLFQGFGSVTKRLLPERGRWVVAGRK